MPLNNEHMQNNVQQGSTKRMRKSRSNMLGAPRATNALPVHTHCNVHGCSNYRAQSATIVDLQLEVKALEARHIELLRYIRAVQQEKDSIESQLSTAMQSVNYLQRVVDQQNDTIKTMHHIMDTQHRELTELLCPDTPTIHSPTPVRACVNIKSLDKACLN